MRTELLHIPKERAGSRMANAAASCCSVTYLKAASSRLRRQNTASSTHPSSEKRDRQTSALSLSLSRFQRIPPCLLRYQYAQDSYRPDLLGYGPRGRRLSRLQQATDNPDSVQRIRPQGVRRRLHPPDVHVLPGPAGRVPLELDVLARHQRRVRVLPDRPALHGPGRGRHAARQHGDLHHLRYGVGAGRRDFHVILRLDVHLGAHIHLRGGGRLNGDSILAEADHFLVRCGRDQQPDNVARSTHNYYVEKYTHCSTSGAGQRRNKPQQTSPPGRSSRRFRFARDMRWVVGQDT
ncbi:hypothetical protein CSUB01_12042 [Colletotrichum sublineola]|uniref:Uncharacterized protein n=1 Tax=Colletotrichum sublineola TaxID=1173701 RepID=A0A066Y087_COLSU|nr:hypothetical protein CSUB01_12042 [Colletotrichum sublineola]